MTKTTAEHGPAAKKTVFIVDDHALLRHGLTALIESESNLSVCGQATCCQSGLEAIREQPPSLVIVDLELGGSNGLDLVKALRRSHPDIPVLVLSMHDETVYAERSLRAGARGYISKKQLDEKVLLAIHRVLAGETYLSDSLTGQMASKFIEGTTLDNLSALDALSDRELQVFRWIGRGRSTRQIAAALNLSVKTIESHRAHIKHKLGIDTAEKLAQRATLWVQTGQTK